MKYFFAMVLSLFAVVAMAQQKISMNFNNEELSKVIETYSKASGQKFIIDPSVRGKISILLPEPVSSDEAFNHLSSALAINGYAISKQADTMVIRTARNVQRDLIEVSTARPSLKPERMYTWIYKAKFVPVEELSRELRILNSKDGELTTFARGNQIIMSDWVANINRVADLLIELDKPVDAVTAKTVEAYRKERAAWAKEHASKEQFKQEAVKESSSKENSTKEASVKEIPVKKE